MEIWLFPSKTYRWVLAFCGHQKAPTFCPNCPPAIIFSWIKWIVLFWNPHPIAHCEGPRLNSWIPFCCEHSHKTADKPFHKFAIPCLIFWASSLFSIAYICCLFFVVVVFFFFVNLSKNFAFLSAFRNITKSVCIICGCFCLPAVSSVHWYVYVSCLLQGTKIKSFTKKIQEQIDFVTFLSEEGQQGKWEKWLW